ncbi:MAG: HD domain-containing protein [Gammaproteobacteria bacterium]|nr:HD domain-containing protein [Gammaproteobacteria bacterium]
MTVVLVTVTGVTVAAGGAGGDAVAAGGAGATGTVDTVGAAVSDVFSAAEMQEVHRWVTAEFRPGDAATVDALRAGAETVDILRPLGMDAQGLLVALLQPLWPVDDGESARLAARFGDSTVDLLQRAWQMRQLSALFEMRGGGKGGRGGSGGRGGPRGSGGSRGPRGQLNDENLRKMLIAFVDDIRVVLLELARHLVALRRAREAGAAEQTALGRLSMEVYAPLANRLGMRQFKWRMEDLALRFLRPAEYRDLAAKLAETRAAREQYIGEFTAAVRAALAAAGLDAEVYGRPKHLFGIWKKMRAKGLAFDDLRDIRALRIVVGGVADCYAALAAVHTRWSHLPADFSDYIATPKANGYRSIHTVVTGPRGLSVEVQIRTAEMHAFNELGVAAHWRYKEGARGDEHIDNKIKRLRQLLEWKDEVRGGAVGGVDAVAAGGLSGDDARDGGASGGDGETAAGDGDSAAGDGETAPADDRVYVFTPKGMVIDLPGGATPIDFAYAIHTQVGHRIRGALVDGKMAPLNRPLQTGQRVQIQTARAGHPSRDWLRKDLGYARSRRARNRIALWFKRADTAQHLADGRGMLERELTRLGLEDLSYDKIARAAHFNKADDLLAALGAGDFKLSRALSPFRPSRPARESRPAGRETPGPAESSAAAPRQAHAAQSAHRPTRGGDFSVSGVGNVLTRMANCCSPIPGDSIVGFITSGRGVSIHRRDCANLRGLDDARRARLVEVKWGQSELAAWPVELRIAAYQRAGLLHDITQLFQAEKVEVAKLLTQTDAENNATIRVKLEIPGLKKLGRITRRLQQIPDVQQVRRVVS